MAAKIKTEDKRTVRTKAQIRQALISLLHAKPLTQITVTEIAAQAEINRGTFYLYYKDVFDLMQHIQSGVMLEFSVNYEKFLQQKISYSSFSDFLTFVFKFIFKNADLARVVLLSNHENSIISTFVIYVEAQLIELRPDIAEQSPYTLQFLVHGIIGVLRQWVEKDMPHPPEKMVEYIVGFVTKDPSGLILF